MGKKKVTFAKQGVIYTYGDNNSQVKKALSHQVSRRIYKRVVGLRRKIALYFYLNF
jgi:hypothetical protein